MPITLTPEKMPYYTIGTNIQKTYTALLTQTSTNAPTAIILYNTIGDIVWTYDSTGKYIATLTDAFTTDKTTIIMQPPQYTGVIFDTFHLNASTLILQTEKETGGSFTKTDGYLFKTMITITIHP